MGRTVPLSAGGSTARVSLSWWLYPRVRQLMAREAFDVVHVHEPLAPLLPYLVLHHSRAVNIGTFHAYSSRQRLYRISRPALSRLQRRLHGRIAVSPAARAFVAPHFPNHAYRVIPNGIEYDRFARAEPFPHLRDGRRNVLFVGRKDERKGLRYLLAATLELVVRRSDLRLIVVGPGEPDRECARLLARIADTAPRNRDAHRSGIRPGPATLLRQRRRVLQSGHRGRELRHRVAGGHGGRNARGRIEHRRVSGRGNGWGAGVAGTGTGYVCDGRGYLAHY